MKFAHLRGIINPFGTLRGISIFNYPVMDSFFTKYLRHIVLLQKVTTCFMNRTKRPGVAMRKGTTCISHSYRMMNFFFYLFKIRKADISLQEAVAQTAHQVWCFILVVAQLFCRSGGGSGHHISEMCESVDSAQGLLQGLPALPAPPESFLC